MDVYRQNLYQEDTNAKKLVKQRKLDYFTGASKIVKKWSTILIEAKALERLRYSKYQFKLLSQKKNHNQGVKTVTSECAIKRKKPEAMSHRQVL